MDFVHPQYFMSERPKTVLQAMAINKQPVLFPLLSNQQTIALTPLLPTSQTKLPILFLGSESTRCRQGEALS